MANHNGPCHAENGGSAVTHEYYNYPNHRQQTLPDFDDNVFVNLELWLCIFKDICVII